VTGVIFGQRRAGRHHVNIPTHFWKIVYVPEGGGHVAAFLMRNVASGATPVTALVTVEQLEAAALLRPTNQTHPHFRCSRSAGSNRA
jgi:DNA/RNA endonuclease G (NUC1)